ncbi:G protein-regulated inducer of neurite outgrowth 1 [Ochotona curzoniae]|uniref:G protein-regulated inducer of neurite outgrowth 1 n=1 Tax=Ochotona curzoniae TaxID=130825 RepID=UPI001B34FC45|nr:G protein-regulated inducer of neurite outgrowth 1 [Ochotona curzoniae]
MGTAEEPTWLQLPQKDSHPRGLLCCPQDGSREVGGPAMKECGPSQQKDSPAPSRQSPDHSTSMDSRLSGPAGPGAVATCSEGPAGSLGQPSQSCSPLQELATQEAAASRAAPASGTVTASSCGQPEPGSSENTNPTFLEKMDSESAEQADSTPMGKSEPAGLVAPGGASLPAPGEEDGTHMQKVEAMCASKGVPVSPRKEDAGSPREVDPVLPRQEEPTCSRNEHPKSSGQVDPASGDKAAPAREADTSTEHAKLGPLRSAESASGPVASGTAAAVLGSSREMDPAPRGHMETVTSAKQDPGLLRKEDPPPSGEGGAGSERMAKKEVSTGQGEPLLPGEPETASLKPGDLPASGKWDPAEPWSPGQVECKSEGKIHPSPSQGADPMIAETRKMTPPGQGNPKPSGKAGPASSHPGDPPSSGRVVDPPSSRGKGEPPALEKEGPAAPTQMDATSGARVEAERCAPVKAVPSESGAAVASGQTHPVVEVSSSSAKVDRGTPGNAEAGPGPKAGPLPLEQASAVPDAKVEPGTFGKTELKSGDKAEAQRRGPGAAASLPKEGTLATEKADPKSSGKEEASVSPGKAESLPSAQGAPLTVQQVQSSSQQSDRKTCGSVPCAGGAGSSESRTRSETAAASGKVSSLSPKDLAAVEATAPPAGPRTRDNFTKAPSWDASAPPPREDAGTQAGAQACVSVAVSPMSPQDGAGGPAFSFQAAPLAPSQSPGPPSRRDAGLQVSLGAAETRSVATGPMTPQAAGPLPAAPPAFPEVRVKPGSVLAAAVAPQEAAEPVRDVSWDEKGMTWEVYGASMEVEVLGMAIQKHLERQIEEHGRQGAPPPPAAAAAAAARAGPGRAGSVRAASQDGAAKRPPGLFRALLQSVRRPRCCSRAGPTAE